ncbi:MAG TPA: hypothetical protein PKH39_15295 [Woeseiaceae bacterium]|nr:hypothetical protein [Woeseiaceae bacterium]
MTSTEFENAMSANGYEVHTGWSARRDSGVDSVWEGSMAMYSPYAKYKFENVSGIFKLLSSSIESSCTFAPDNGGAFESIFPESKTRTKELFANSAAPLGFVVGKDFPDAVKSRSYWTLRVWPSSIEEMLSARFEEVDGGTKVVVNTESDRLALKSRDVSFARSILEHMHCTNSLLSVDRVEPTAFDPASEIHLSRGQKLSLSNYRVLTSGDVLGGKIVLEYVVASDVVNDGKTAIRRGAPAWGEAIVVHEDGVSNIHIRMTKVQASDGRWYGVTLENDPLILKAPEPDVPEGQDKSVAVISSAHIVYPIGAVVSATVELALDGN